MVTGTVFSGAVAVGDKLVMSPSNIPVRVRSIHAQNRPAQTGVAGQRCALNLAGPGFDKAAVARGDWVLAEPLHASVTRLDARLRVLASEDKPLRHWTPVHVHLGATDVTGRVSVLEGEVVVPGMDALVQLHLQRLLDTLTAEHARVTDMLGVDREHLRRMTAPTLSRTAFLALTDELLAAGNIKASGLWLHLPGHSVTLLAHEEKLWAKVRPLLEAAPYQPPSVRDIAHALDVDERAMRLVMQHLARLGEVFQVAHDHFFTRDAVAALAAIARKLAEDEALEAAAFRDRIGVGRKLAIQILEFFDRVGFTRRARDSHKLRHANLFAG